MRWTEEQLISHQSKQLAVIGKQHGLIPAKASKHKNHKVIVGSEKFDSKREYQRWCELQMMQRQGLISQLQRQVPYELIPSVVLDGRKKPAIKYVCDFLYFQHGEWVVEDSKSPHLRTDPVYRIKKHTMKHVHGIDIKEV